VQIVSPAGKESFTQGEKIIFKWNANDADNQELKYAISLSADSGENWLPIDMDIAETQYEFDTAGLDVGNYVLRVIATDGVNSGEAISKEFAVKAVTASAENKGIPNANNEPKTAQGIDFGFVAMVGIIILVIIGAAAFFRFGKKK
jgi:predicted phage tail protein